MFSGRNLICRDVLLDWEKDSSNASINIPHVDNHSDSISTGDEIDTDDDGDVPSVPTNVHNMQHPDFTLFPYNNVGRELFGIPIVPIPNIMIHKNPDIGSKNVYSEQERKSVSVLSLTIICGRKVVDISIKNTLKIDQINTDTTITAFYSIFNTFKISYSSFLRMVGFYTSTYVFLEDGLYDLGLPKKLVDYVLKPLVHERMWTVHRIDIYFKLMFHYRMFHFLTATFFSTDIGGV